MSFWIDVDVNNGPIYSFIKSKSYARRIHIADFAADVAHLINRTTVADEISDITNYFLSLSISIIKNGKSLHPKQPRTNRI